MAEPYSPGTMNSVDCSRFLFLHASIRAYLSFGLACDAKDMTIAPTEPVLSAAARKKEGVMACALTPESPAFSSATIARASTCTANVFGSEVASNENTTHKSESTVSSILAGDGACARGARLHSPFERSKFWGFQSCGGRRTRSFRLCASLRVTALLRRPRPLASCSSAVSLWLGMYINIRAFSIQYE